jgi:hypothetical protein
LSADTTSIQITWTAPDHDGNDEILGYYIYWDDNTGVLIETALSSTGKNTLTFSQSGLQTGKYYIFTVTAYNGIGESV